MQRVTRGLPRPRCSVSSCFAWMKMHSRLDRCRADRHSRPTWHTVHRVVQRADTLIQRVVRRVAPAPGKGTRMDHWCFYWIHQVGTMTRRQRMKKRKKDGVDPNLTRPCEVRPVGESRSRKVYKRRMGIGMRCIWKDQRATCRIRACASDQ